MNTPDNDLLHTLVLRHLLTRYRWLLLLLGLGAMIVLLAQDTKPFAWLAGNTVVLLVVAFYAKYDTHALVQLWRAYGQNQHGGTVIVRSEPDERVAQLLDSHVDEDQIIDWSGTPRTAAPEAQPLQIYDLFLSYHAPDRPAVMLIAERLRRAGLRLWFDHDEILAGQPWMGRVEHGLRCSRAVAVIIGPAGMGRWQEQEAGVAIRMSVRAGSARPVIPVLLPGADRDGLPLLLDSFSWVEFRHSLDDDATFARLVAGVQVAVPVADPVERMRARA